MKFTRTCLIVSMLIAPFSLMAQDVEQASPPQEQTLVMNDPSPSSSWPGSQTQNGNGNGKGRALPVKGYVFPTNEEMKEYWLQNLAGPRAIIGGAFTASWGTWAIHSPEEWDKDFGGWSKRFGSALTDIAINQTSLVLLSHVWSQDPRYFRCDCAGAGPRTRHAFKMVFDSRNRKGEEVFAPPKVISMFTGPLVTRTAFYPGQGPGDALKGGIYYVGGGFLWNLVKEFIWESPRW